MWHSSSAVSVRSVSSSSCSLAAGRAFLFLTELLAKSPDAERNQDKGKNRQRQEIGPKSGEPTSFEHASANDGREMVNGIDNRQGLHPSRHGFDRIHSSRQRRQRR